MVGRRVGESMDEAGLIVRAGEDTVEVLGNAPVRTFVVREVPVEVRVVAHDHTYWLSVIGGRYLGMVGIRDGDVVVVKDPRGIAFHSRVRVRGRRAYIHIPKPFWKYYQRGDALQVIITPV